MQDPSTEPSAASSPVELTRFLNELGRGEMRSSTQMMRIVLGEMKKIAEGSVRGEQPGQTLNATALVNEAFVKLFDRENVEWSGRKHFYTVAAKAMRHLLVDQARRRKRRAKTAGPATTSVPAAAGNGVDVDLMDLESALDELATLDERQARVVELKFFGGLEVAAIARVLEVSKTTVEREWRAARAWLAMRLDADS